MNVFLTIFAAFITLLFGTAEAKSIDRPLSVPIAVSSATYVIKRGDTLTAITKKFPGTTIAGIAEANGIKNPDLIYPEATLSLPKTSFTTLATPQQTKAGMTPKEARVHAPQRTLARAATRSVSKTACDMAPILARLHYPPRVTEQFGKMMEARVDAKKGFPFSATVAHNGADYHLLFEGRCIATKLVDLRGVTLGEAAQDPTPHENTAALTPRQRVEIVTKDTEPREKARLTDTAFAQFLAQIKKELQEIMGPDEDVTPLVVLLALAILRKTETDEAALSLFEKQEKPAQQ